jgi:CubicO group peptidase (beta-lactamase class C family)
VRSGIIDYHRSSSPGKRGSSFFSAKGVHFQLRYGSREGAETRRDRASANLTTNPFMSKAVTNPESPRIRASARTQSLTCRWRGLAGLALLSLAAPTQAAEPTPYQRALAAGYKALFLCSGLFDARRTQEQVEALELSGIYPEYQALLPGLRVERPFDRNRVHVWFDPSMPPRIAYRPFGLGCTLAPIGRPLPEYEISHGVVWEPLKFSAKRWPIGDAGVAPKPNRALAAIAVSAFDPSSYGQGARSTGLVVVQDGNIVAERYADGFTALTANRTWSVAKSIAGTLIGVAASQGVLDPHKAAPVPEWQSKWDFAPDPRANITIDHLLRMASGLHSDTAGNRTDALYMGATSVTQETIHWPLEVPPGSRFRYANNDTLLAVRALRAALHDDDQYREYPRKHLFEKIGMSHTTAGTDFHDNFILSSQVWSTARDLARLGLLWLNDGVWQGERILPEGWVKYMTTPSGPQPAEGPGYGATLWLFGPRQGLPEGSYAAQGNRGQFIMVVPSHKLVIVRRGEDPHGSRFDIAKFTADVIAALK